MSPDLNDKITSSLRRQAEQIEVPQPLDADAYRRLHQQRTRRSVLAAATGVSALVAGSWVVRSLAGSDDDVSIDRPQVSFRLDELPRGEPPAVPWSLAGVIYDGDREIPVDIEGNDGPVLFVPVAGGYVVGGGRLIGIDGTVQDPLPVDGMPRVSADGETLAWMETVVAEENGAGEAELTTADAISGEVLHQTTVPLRGTVVGFLNRAIVFEDIDGQAHLWNPPTDEVTSLDGVRSVRFTNGRNLLAAYEESDRGERCTTVLDTSRDFAPTWTRCRYLLGGFTQDGRYGLLHSTTEEKRGHSSYLVDASTGEELLRFRDVQISSSPVIEPGSDVLVEVDDFDRDQRAIVRCSLDGDSELATGLTSPLDEIGPHLPIRR